MCDQDHFDDDLKEFDARGLVTRRQFGVLLGAGVAMMLPQVANAVERHRIGRDHHDARRHRRLLLRAPGERHGSRRARVAGHLRPAAGVPHDGQTPRRIRLLGAGRQPVLSRQEGADRRTGRRDADPVAAAARAGAERDDAHDRREGVHRVAGSAAVGRQEPQDRHAGLLHGRPDGVPHVRRGARSRRRGRLVPRRRARHAERRTARICRRRRRRRSSSSRSPQTTTCARPTRRTC